MTAHELARKLLEGPDLPAAFEDYEGNVHKVDEVVTQEERLLFWEEDYEVLAQNTPNVPPGRVAFEWHGRKYGLRKDAPPESERMAVVLKS